MVALPVSTVNGSCCSRVWRRRGNLGVELLKVALSSTPICASFKVDGALCRHQGLSGLCELLPGKQLQSVTEGKRTFIKTRLMNIQKLKSRYGLENETASKRRQQSAIVPEEAAGPLTAVRSEGLWPGTMRDNPVRTWSMT